MWNELGVTGEEAVVVVVTTIVIAIALVLLLRVLGPRSLARVSTFDVAVLLVIGSAAGRVLTGYTPTLAAGVIALVTLVALSWGADAFGRTRIGAAVLRERPVLLIDGTEVLTANLRRARVSEAHLWEALRIGGIRNLAEVTAVVLEANGTISIIREGAPLDPRLMAGVSPGSRSA